MAAWWIACAVACAAAAWGGAGWVASERIDAATIAGAPAAAVPASPWRPTGPLLDRARARGTLTVEVRAYRRPAPPGVPPALEADGYDAELARYLARQLGVDAHLVWRDGDGNGQADISLVGAAGVADGDVLPPGASAAGRHVPTPYARGAGALAVLRSSGIAAADDLAGKPVCVGRGSPYAARLAVRHAAVPRFYPSAIHAIAGFMAGECAALAEDRLVLDRMLGTPDWRFYRLLGTPLATDRAGPQIALGEADPASAAWLDWAVNRWVTDGELSRARTRRAAALNYEAAQLLSGFVCHS